MSSGTAERNPGHRGPETAALSKETLLEKIEEAAALYHRLVLVVADSGSGKTRLLRRISEELEFPLVNVNRELSRRLLDLTERQRTLRLPRLLHEIVDEADADVILREFEEYRASTQRRLKLFRLEAVRAGFKKAWQEHDYATIIAVAAKIPETVLQEDPKLLMWYDQAVTRSQMG